MNFKSGDDEIVHHACGMIHGLNRGPFRLKQKPLAKPMSFYFPFVLMQTSLHRTYEKQKTPQDCGVFV